MTEEWRPVTDYEGVYEVSNLGNVRSITRSVPAGGGRMRLAEGRVLSIYMPPNHYGKVRLKSDGVGSTKNVHRLVAEAFLGPCPDGMEVCHRNGDRYDNRAENLRYGTHSSNQLDQAEHGVGQAAKTHCSHGHAYTPENTHTYVWPRTGQVARRCRACSRERIR